MVMKKPDLPFENLIILFYRPNGFYITEELEFFRRIEFKHRNFRPNVGIEVV